MKNKEQQEEQKKQENESRLKRDFYAISKIY